MEGDDTGSVLLGVRILLAVPTLACLQLPGWWKLAALIPGTLALTGFRRQRGMRDWDIPGQAGTYPLEVVGVQHYVEHLARVLDGSDLTGEGSGVVVPAVLVAERENAVDPNAVAIHIGGVPVGHLARAVAAAAQPAVLELNRMGLRPRLNALVTGRRDGQDRLQVRVRIDLSGFEALRALPDRPL